MGIFNPGSGTGRHPRATAQRLEVLIGILGVFTLMALIQTVVLEFRGDNAVGAAIVLAVLVLVTGYAIHRRTQIKL